MRLRTSLPLVAMLAMGCHLTLDRDLGPGELRAQLMIRTSSGLQPASDATAILVGSNLRGNADAKGLLVLRDVPAGTMTLRLSKAGQSGQPSFGLVVRDLVLTGETGATSDGRDLGELILGEVGSIDGTVVKDGAPVVGAVVSGVDGQSAITDASGQFQFAALAAGDYALKVQTGVGEALTLYGSTKVTVEPAKAATVALDLSTMTPGTDGSVSGQALELGVADWSGIDVWLAPQGTHAWQLVGESNADGLYTSGAPMKAGAYVLAARARDGAATQFQPVFVDGDTSLPPIYLIANLPDRDGDGFDDAKDDCPSAFDELQVDTNHDGVGDACDPDIDGDGVPNEQDHTLTLLSGDGQTGVVGSALEVPIVVEVRDGYGDLMPGATLDAAFSPTDGLLSPDPVADSTGLVQTTFTLPTTPGDVTLTLSAEGTTPIVVHATALVGPVASFGLAPPTDLPLRATATAKFQVTAFDAFGNVTPYAGPLTFASSDTSAVLPSTATMTAADDGVALFPIVFGAPGNWSLTVSADDALGELDGLVVGDVPRCGDGIIDTDFGENCEDGNAVTEACDYGLESCVVCTAACVEGPGLTSFCSDGHVDRAHEVCDDGNADPADDCNACEDTFCGDGVTQAIDFETCDDQNTDNNDGCTSLCLAPFCGDDFVQTGETCDDGVADPHGACTDNCVAARCGDGVIQAGEECDDGGDSPTCDASCRHKSCDGVALHPAAEATPTRHVTSLADSGPGSLRNVLAAATATDVIDFQVTGTITLATQIVISKNATIVGPGASQLVIDGAGATRLFQVSAGVTLFVEGVTLQNGHVSNDSGGCVSNFGTFVMSESTLQGCTIDDGNNSGKGGGALVNWTGGVITLSHVLVTNNIANYRTTGGAVWNSGTMTVCWSRFSQNRAANGDGSGGIQNHHSLAVFDSTFDANRCLDYGGAIGVDNGATGTVIARSTFVGNIAGTFGGGLANLGASPVSIESSSFVGNAGSRAGGGVYGPMTLANCLIAKSTPDDYAGPAVSSGHNLIGSAPTATTSWQPTDHVGTSTPVDAKVATTVADAGGTTPTVLLLDGSPALDAGLRADAIDQRGFAGTVGTADDIGAVESALPRFAAFTAHDVAARRASFEASVQPSGRATSVTFEYAPTADFSASITTAARNVGSGSVAVDVGTRVGGLSPSTTYFVRAHATNGDGTVTSATTSFKTPANP